jgi:hypothetical protein
MSTGKGVWIGVAGTALAAATLFLGWRQYVDTPRGDLQAVIEVSHYAAPPQPDTGRLLRDGSDSYLGTFFDVSVSNNGTERVERVTLTIPYAKLWCISRESQPRACGEPPSAIVIDTLAPLERAGVQVWASAGANLELNKTRLIHSHGIGRVKLVTVALPYSDHFLRFMLFMFGGLFAWIFIYELGRRAGGREERAIARRAKRQVLEEVQARSAVADAE